MPTTDWLDLSWTEAAIWESLFGKYGKLFAEMYMMQDMQNRWMNKF